MEHVIHLTVFFVLAIIWSGLCFGRNEKHYLITNKSITSMGFGIIFLGCQTSFLLILYDAGKHLLC